MRIAFIQFVSYEYLGLMYLSSSVKVQGHETEVFIETGNRPTPGILKSVSRYRPQIIGFSVMSGSEELALELAALLKERTGAFIVFGGPHPTHQPQIIEQDCVDCVCIGEAERSFTTIAEDISRGCLRPNVPGAWIKCNGSIVRNDLDQLEQDLTVIPRPDRSLYRAKYPSFRHRRATFLAGRGCPYQCTFCSNHSLMRMYREKGAYVRIRPVSDVIDEIRDTVSKHGIQAVYLHDDTFGRDVEWTYDFCDRYRRSVNLPFSCQLRADTATVGIVQALARANCKTVSFGIESGHPVRRAEVLKKSITDDQIIRCAALLRQHGIRFRTYNMVGLPQETVDDAFLTVRINQTIGTDYPWCSIFQPLPGTDLLDHCRSARLMDNGAKAAQPSFFHGTAIFLGQSDELVNLQKLFLFAVKFPRLERLIRWAIRSRPNRFYDLIFALGHAWLYKNSEIVTTAELLSVGTSNIRRYLGGLVEQTNTGLLQKKSQ